MRIAFVGGGVMAEAMIRGLLRKRLVKTADVTVGEISIERRAFLNSKYALDPVADNASAIEGVEVIVLAVKPASLEQVAKELKGRIQQNQLVVSILAGKSLAAVAHGLGHSIVVRAMPNTPAQVGEGMIVWTASPDVTEDQREKARSILGTLGKEIFVTEEKYMDMATAVSGSGPAYVLLVMESLIDAGVHIGLSRDVAQQLVLQTMWGTVLLAQKSAQHPAELRNMVTSPGGTTTEGLLQLERSGLRAMFTEAVSAAYEKAKELGRGTP